jgi:hypothetical protein
VQLIHDELIPAAANRIDVVDEQPEAELDDDQDLDPNTLH